MSIINRSPIYFSVSVLCFWRHSLSLSLSFVFRFCEEKAEEFVKGNNTKQGGCFLLLRRRRCHRGDGDGRDSISFTLSLF